MVLFRVLLVHLRMHTAYINMCAHQLKQNQKRASTLVSIAFCFISISTTESHISLSLFAHLLLSAIVCVGICIVWCLEYLGLCLIFNRYAVLKMQRQVRHCIPVIKSTHENCWLFLFAFAMHGECMWYHFYHSIKSMIYIWFCMCIATTMIMMMMINKCKHGDEMVIYIAQWTEFGDKYIGALILMIDTWRKESGKTNVSSTLYGPGHSALFNCTSVKSDKHTNALKLNRNLRKMTNALQCNAEVCLAKLVNCDSAHI